MLKIGPDKRECELEYNIFCNVKVIEKTFKEEADNWTQHTSKMVLLIPRFDSGEYAGFANAWLPDFIDHITAKEKGLNLDEHGNEIVMRIGHPINGPCRGFVRRANKDCPKPHIFVMSTGVEEMLKENFDKKLFKIFNIRKNTELRVTVLPEGMDEIADRAATTERNVRKTY